MNQWNYVEGNPINRIDPSGNTWITPDWCQMMPTKWLYEGCVLKKYGLESIDLFPSGKTVTGQPGCYSGPTEYRAPGYLEGLEVTPALVIPQLMFGQEVVYDFATMQRARFKFKGVVQTNGVGISASMYTGRVLGFKSNTNLIDSYRGDSIVWAKGVSAIANAGTGGFVSLSDIRLRGNTWYIGVGLIANYLAPLDISAGQVYYAPVSNEIPYARNGKVDRARLFIDISWGIESPWKSIGLQGPDLSPGTNPNPLLIFSGGSRLYGYYLVNKYADAYDPLFANAHR
jgi:hypothetical protein